MAATVRGAARVPASRRGPRAHPVAERDAAFANLTDGGLAGLALAFATTATAPPANVAPMLWSWIADVAAAAVARRRALPLAEPALPEELSAAELEHAARVLAALAREMRARGDSNSLAMASLLLAISKDVAAMRKRRSSDSREGPGE